MTVSRLKNNTVLEKSQQEDLPKGWVKTTVGEISSICSGIGFQKKYQGKKYGKYPFYKVGDISKTVKNGHIMLTKSDNYVSQEICTLLKGKIFAERTIVFAKIGEALKLNRRAICSRDSLCDNNIMGLLANLNVVHTLYFYYFFNTINLGNLSRSTIVPSIRKTDVESIIIPLPPLPEQYRIVLKIESIFAQIDAGKKKLDGVKKLLKHTKQTVLKEEFKMLDKHYDSQKLDQLSVKITDGTHFTPKYQNSGIPFISVKDVQNERIYFDNCRYVSQETHEKLIKRCHPEFGDLLITKSGTIGRIAIVDTKMPFSLFVSVALIKLKRDINKNYLKFFLQNFFNHIDISQQIKGVVVKNFHLEDIKQVIIPLPPLNEQKRIASKIESIFGRIDANFIKTRIIKLIHNYDYFA